MPDPKKTKERLFLGRVWVDDQDLQIVKTKGKGVPETKNNKFPIVETYREHIDGRYWFPTYSYADEELVFDNGNTLHVRMKVRIHRLRSGARNVEGHGNWRGRSAGNRQADAKPIEGGDAEFQSRFRCRSPLIRKKRRDSKIRASYCARRCRREWKGDFGEGVRWTMPYYGRAAEAAARQATFAPTTQDGITVRVDGRLSTYDYQLKSKLLWQSSSRTSEIKLVHRLHPWSRSVVATGGIIIISIVPDLRLASSLTHQFIRVLDRDGNDRHAGLLAPCRTRLS